MTYTAGRIVNDADAHTMETQDWLAPYLEGEYKEMYSQVYSKREGGDRIVKMIDAFETDNEVMLTKTLTTSNLICR